jgi:hypothetical protein
MNLREAIVGVEPTVPERPREGRERERGMARAVMAPATPIAVVDASCRSTLPRVG